MLEINQIYTGDSRELIEGIDDSSIDHILTDPVYENIDDYYWLGKEAMRVLKPNTSMLVWISKPKEMECRDALLEAGLNYVYTLNYTVPAKMSRLMYYHLFVWTTPCLWVTKGRALPNRWITDTVISQAAPDNGFKWNKNLEITSRWMTAFSKPGDLVLDPFIGGGSLPVAAKMAGRNFIGFEIDPDRAEKARDRVFNTPTPLFVEDPIEQMAIDFDAIADELEDPQPA